jgi:hypothetical protein
MPATQESEIRKTIIRGQLGMGMGENNETSLQQKQAGNSGACLGSYLSRRSQSETGPGQKIKTLSGK